MIEKIEKIIDELTEEIVSVLEEPLAKNQVELIGQLFMLYLNYKNDNINTLQFASTYESIMEAKAMKKLINLSDFQIGYNKYMEV